MKIICKIVSGKNEIMTVIKEEEEGRDEDDVEESVVPVIEQVKVEDIDGDKTKVDFPLDEKEQGDDLDSSLDSGRLQIVTSNSDVSVKDIEESECLNSISTETSESPDPHSVSQSVTATSGKDTEITATVAVTVNADSVALEEVQNADVSKKCDSSVTIIKVESDAAEASRSHGPTSLEAIFGF